MLFRLLCHIESLFEGAQAGVHLDHETVNQYIVVKHATIWHRERGKPLTRINQLRKFYD